MKNYLTEIITLLGDERKRLPKFFLLFLLVSILDLIGIGLIGPYIAIVVDPDLAKDIFSKVDMFISFPENQKSQISNYSNSFV